MPGIVEQLEKDTLNMNLAVSDLLRRALVVARTLKEPEFEKWIGQELKGYSDHKSVPEYRVLDGTPMVTHPSGRHEEIRLHNLDTGLAKAITRFYMNFPIASFEEDLRDPTAEFFATSYQHPEEVKLTRALSNLAKPWVRYTRSHLQGILEAVRNELLDWCHRLREKDIEIGSTHKMPDLVKTTQPLLRTVIIGAYVVGVLLACLGVLLIYLGAKGNTEFVFFGQTFKSESVGIASIFIGACVIVLLIRRALTSYDKAGRN